MWMASSTAQARASSCCLPHDSLLSLSLKTPRQNESTVIPGEGGRGGGGDGGRGRGAEGRSVKAVGLNTVKVLLHTL